MEDMTSGVNIPEAERHIHLALSGQVFNFNVFIAFSKKCYRNKL